MIAEALDDNAPWPERKAAFRGIERQSDLKDLIRDARWAGPGDLTMVPVIGVDRVREFDPIAEVTLLAEGEEIVPVPLAGWGEPQPGPHTPVSTAPMYHVRLRNVVAVGRSGAIHLPGRAVLSEMLAHPAGDSIEMRDPPFLASSRDWTILESAGLKPARGVAQAIHMLNSSPTAFGHWQADFCPRWEGYDAAEIPHEVPILVDGLMPPAHFEMLDILSGGRPIIRVTAGEAIAVDELHFCNRQNWLPNYYKPGRPAGTQHVTVSPRGLRFVRRKFRNASEAAGVAGRLYVARHKQTKRKLANSEEVASAFRRRDFRVSTLVGLPFRDQLALTANARAMAGPMGSGMDQVIYQDEGGRALVLSSPHTGSYANFLGSLRSIPIEVKLVFGTMAGEHSVWGEMHSDFNLDPADIEAGIEWLLTG